MRLNTLIGVEKWQPNHSSKYRVAKVVFFITLVTHSHEGTLKFTKKIWKKGEKSDKKRCRVVGLGGPYATKLLFIGGHLGVGGPSLSVGCIPLGVNRIT